MYSSKASSRSDNLVKVIQVILTLRRTRNKMSQQAWNTAVMGLCLTVICLVGASSFRLETGQTTRNLSLIQKDKVHEVVTEFCSKIPDSFRFFVESLCNIFSNYMNEKRFRTAKTELTEDVVDMTIINHAGSCQCEGVTFMMEAPRSLKIEAPSMKGAHDDEALNKNTFTKTIVQQKHFSLIQGKENIRSYQKPFKPKETEYHHALAVYAFSHRSKRDQALNPNTIQTFCGLCGTQLVWKPHHRRDAHPLLHVNVHCLKSNWIPLPKTEHHLVKQQSLSSSRKTVTLDLQKRRDSSGELSTIPSTVSSATSSVHSENSHIKEEHKLFHAEASAAVSTTSEDDLEKAKYESTVHDPLEQKLHSFLSVEGEDMERSVCSETASTVTNSSMSMTSGWRLRDPNGVWSSMGSATSTNSKISLEDRLSDKDSQDALLFQMRKHLSSHTSPRNALPKVSAGDEDESDFRTNNDEKSTATSVKDNIPATPATKRQTAPMSNTKKSLFGSGSRKNAAKLVDDDSSASVVSALDNDSPGFIPPLSSQSQVYEPPSIFFNKLLRPTR
ncbi:hypothetical protein FisN_10Lh102 [Fistulifera solaris]|uniref:Uncharacterized protein n=1 Tax=Fistulifera solaris TaxID=1519565 RepID=A0A1Z5JT96_FISSO|nr:hypothetical protein FisN_10Lh102 [Fistulifera solaris]|eukprot:GAX17245.1 hypothetical protein FisN_10Lh102 [Fistulifera solaris]